MLGRRRVSQLQPKKPSRSPKESSVLSPMTTRGGDTKQAGLDGWAFAWQFLDTSWRVALPIAGLSYLGIRLDRHFDTNPLYSLIGLFVSLFVAGALVYKQLKLVYPDFFKKGGENK